MDYVASIMGEVLVQLPLYITWLVGIVLALVRWKRHPRVSLMTVIALTSMLVLTIAFTSDNLWLPFLIKNLGLGPIDIGPILLIRIIPEFILLPGVWIVLLAAIFGGRKPKAQAN